jgi:hypothetical protein
MTLLNDWSKLGWGKRLAAIFFALLSLGFLLRTGEYAYKWLTHVPANDMNYKVLTIWGLIYFVATTAIAIVIVRLGADEGVAEAAGDET